MTATFEESEEKIIGLRQGKTSNLPKKSGLSWTKASLNLANERSSWHAYEPCPKFP
jgi:hypothetical protein